MATSKTVQTQIRKKKKELSAITKKHKAAATLKKKRAELKSITRKVASKRRAKGSKGKKGMKLSSTQMLVGVGVLGTIAYLATKK